MLIGSLNLSGPSLVLKKVKDFISDQHSPQANNNPSTLVEVNQAILAWSYTDTHYHVFRGGHSSKFKHGSILLKFSDLTLC